MSHVMMSHDIIEVILHVIYMPLLDLMLSPCVQVVHDL